MGFLQKICFYLRCVLSLIGAFGVLYALSYPDSILPPSPDIEYVTGFTLYDIKPVIWLFPLLFMEVVTVVGPKRNGVWFFSLCTILLGGIIVYPVLQATVPELTAPTLSYEDRKLGWGLFYFAVLLAVSFLFRYGLLAYLLELPRENDDDAALMDVDVLKPEKARTVMQIATDPVRVHPHFRFGDADHHLIDRFVQMMRRLLRSRRRRKGIYATLGLLLALWFFLYPQPSLREAMQRDLRVMYEHRRLPDGNFQATRRAVHAALRVLDYVSSHEVFAGKTFAEAEEWLQIYRAPGAYRRVLLDASDITLASVDSTFESRTRFFTVSDGTRTAVLFVRTDKEGARINVSELVIAGWNAEEDDKRRRYGLDIHGRILSPSF